MNADKTTASWSEDSLGVPLSPNRNLEELRVFRQIDVTGHQVEFYGLSDIRSGVRLGFAGRGAAGEFRTYGRVIAGLGIMFHNDPECHIHSIVRARPRCVRRFRQPAWALQWYGTWYGDPKDHRHP